MVSEAREKRPRDPMAVEVTVPSLPPPRAHSRLHNFVFPSQNWGIQKKLRCMKVVDGEGSLSHHRSPAVAAAAAESYKKRRFSPTSPARSSLDKSWPKPPQIGDPKASEELEEGEILEEEEEEEEEDECLKEIRVKLMAHLHDAVDKIKLAAPKEVKEVEESSSVAATEEASRPWNLRTRRAACNAPNESGRRRQNPSPVAPEKNSANKSVGLRPEGSDKKERAKFSLTLSREEVEEDYLLMIGSKPPRRPKKRPRPVQRQLDMLSPGSWLSEITADAYKVPDSPNEI